MSHLDIQYYLALMLVRRASAVFFQLEALDPRPDVVLRLLFRLIESGENQCSFLSLSNGCLMFATYVLLL